MKSFNENVLNIDPESEAGRIQRTMRHQVIEVLRRSGIVISISGGIDSSVSAALAVRAVGPENVLCLSLPEYESNPESVELAKLLTDFLKTRLIVRDIGPILSAFKCYDNRDDAVKRIFPEYNSSYKLKLSLQNNLAEKKILNIYYLVIESPDGIVKRKRLPMKELLEIIAATNHKQRTRKQIEYYYADRHRYAVLGTPNRLEYDQGFFVKGGDGLADLKPIAHLYKSQVYELSKYLNLPDEILNQKPTTDTYSMEQSQDEFFFSFPYDKMDLLLWAFNHDIPVGDVAETMSMTRDQVTWAYNDIVQKRRTTKYLHMKPLLIDVVPEVET